MTFQEILDDLAAAAQTIEKDAVIGIHTAEEAVAVMAPVAKTIISVLAMIGCFKSASAKADLSKAGQVVGNVQAAVETLAGPQ